MINAPGIYFDFDPAAYLRDPCAAPSFSQSIAKVLLERSPAHARLEHPRLRPPGAEDEPEDYRADRAIGNAAHRMLTGRGRDVVVAPFDSWRTKEAREMRDTADRAGRIPILPHHQERAVAMVRAAREQLAAAGHGDAFEPGHGAGEVVLAWQGENDLWLRTMIDWTCTTRPACYDFKTSGLSCAPHVVVERPSELSWDLQAAMFEQGFEVLDPANAGRRRFYFVNQENEPPYGLTVVEISEADLTLGRKKLAMAWDIWRDCMAAGHWPLYPAETLISRPRGWTETRFLEREIAHHERRVLKPERDAANLMAG